MRRNLIPSSLRATAGGLLLCGLAACGGESAVLSACSGDRVCPPPSNQLPWTVQVLPPPNANSGTDVKNQPLAQDDNHLSFDLSGLARVRLRGNAVMTGSVSDAAGQLLVGAHIVARLVSAIPGQNDYDTSSVTGETPRGLFVLRIPLAQVPTVQPYQFWLGFDDPYLASLSPPLWRSEPVFGDHDLPLRLRGLSDLAVVTGRISNALGEGVGNLTVQAFDEQNTLISSTATSLSATGTAAGTYRLLLDPTLPRNPAGPLRIVVRPGTGQDSTLPVLEATLPLPPANSQSRVDFAIPSYRKPVMYQLPIRGSAASAAPPVAGARVRMQVMLEDAATIKLGHKAYYSATGDSDAQGTARLLLVPAPIGGSNLPYQVTIASPSQSPYASVAQQELQVGPNDGLLGAVMLPLRAEIRGRMLDVDGAPVVGAQLIGSRINSTTQVTGPVTAQVATADVPLTVTDSSGRFALRLDPGDYDLEVIPLAGTQARTSIDNQRIGTDPVDLGDVMLPSITLGQIELRTASGQAAVDTKVRIFQLPDLSVHAGVACDGIMPCSPTGKLRAEAFTDKNGRAQFLLPGGSPLLAPH